MVMQNFRGCTMCIMVSVKMLPPTPWGSGKFFPSCQPIPHLWAHGKRQFPIPGLSVIVDLIQSRENGLTLSDPLDITESDDPPYFTKAAAFRASFFTGGCRRMLRLNHFSAKKTKFVKNSCKKMG